MPSFNVISMAIIVPLFMLGLLSLTSESAPTYSAHFCENATTYTPNSTYQINLNYLLSSFSSNATHVNGFYNNSAGQSPNIVYGLFLCRGDVASDVCRDCVSTATKEIVQRCPVEKMTVIWYDECMLRYSDQFIFSIIREVPGYDLPGSQSLTGDLNSFNELLARTMNELAIRAANDQSGKKFATGEEKYTSSQTLYSLVQCTPDLSEDMCIRCFRSAIAGIPMCCSGKQGGRVLLPSCNVRYELYPFYRTNAAATSPSTPSPSGKRRISSQLIVAIVVPLVISMVLLAFGLCFLRRKAMKKRKYNPVEEENGDEITTIQSLQFDLGTIEAATDNFSIDNKIGEGGFGEVFKGILPNGQEIAVKRLSKRSGQGVGEFKNEIALVAKLQHRNLVRLLGFCLDGVEKILVYEYVPNKSLDNFLFDPEQQGLLNWSRRYKIIEGVARGILYLHEDSRLRIIHRDLKTSNILLDGDMNSKISDFGMTRIFSMDQIQGNTKRIVGTYGYMSPEYAMRGHFSAKSDVFSFGVLVLEIITGKKNSCFYQAGHSEDIQSYAWKHWKNGTPLEMMDPTLQHSYSRNEVIKCIHIGLLCVQEDPADRPTMATIVLVLSSYSVTLPLPKRPAIFLRSATTEIGIPTKELQSDQYTTSSMPSSINEVSITEVYPR